MTDFANDPARMARDLDPVRKRLLELAEERGERSLAGLSKYLGRGSTYLSDFIDGSPRKLALEDAVKLADKLEISPAELGVGAKLVEIAKPAIAPETYGRVTSAPGMAFRAGNRDLPILGHAKGGTSGLFIGNGERQGVTMRPEPLIDVEGAYAVRVHDYSMSPALEPGYLLYVHPHRLPKPGDTVVIQMRNGEAFTKRLVRRTEKAIICQQFNPAEEVKYDPAKVKELHLVLLIGTYEL